MEEQKKEQAPSEEMTDTEFWEWMKKNARSVDEIVYPDGTKGELLGNFIAI